MSSLSVATIQMASRAGDVDYNLMQAERLMKAAKKQGAQFVLLPELFDVGYDLNRVMHMAYDTEQTITRLSQISKAQNLYIMAGIYEKALEGSYNSAYVFDPNGEVIAKYRKNKLFCLSKEKEVFTQGKDLATVEIGGIKFGLMICYDIRFPELARRYVDEGCTGLAIISAFPFPRVEHWKTLLKARAIENQLYVVAANRVGENDGFWFHGKSSIIDPWGTLLQEANETDETFAIAHINAKKVEEVREKLPALKDR